MAPEMLSILPPDPGSDPAALLGSDLKPEEQLPSNIVESHNENGVLTQKATYIDGVLEGEFLAYNPQGTVIKKFFYRQGKLQGEALIYNDEGKLAQRLTYEDGVLEGPLQIFSNEVMVVEIPYVKGAREGIMRTFAPNGCVQSQTTLQADKENGARTVYNPESGVIIRTETLVDGVVDGQSLTFYPGGAVMMQQTFVKGLPEGRSVSFYQSGAIQQIAIYEKGALVSPPQQYDLAGKEL
jgi:antitoxin component YwqK of YwqJK toxin-antitoxin module